jgi:hypothetical protein
VQSVVSMIIYRVLLSLPSPISLSHLVIYSLTHFDTEDGGWMFILNVVFTNKPAWCQTTENRDLHDNLFINFQKWIYLKALLNSFITFIYFVILQFESSIIIIAMNKYTFVTYRHKVHWNFNRKLLKAN